MADPRLEYLASDGFIDAIEAFKIACDNYKDIKKKVRDSTNELLNRWEGEGATQFEKDYTLIYGQLEDILDLMLELHDGLIDAQAEYLKTDAALAKQFTA